MDEPNVNEAVFLFGEFWEPENHGGVVGLDKFNGFINDLFDLFDVVDIAVHHPPLDLVGEVLVVLSEQSGDAVLVLNHDE